ncbi:MAG: hypothetical protein R3B09_19615 [Nannocystaceae bacterium]
MPAAAAIRYFRGTIMSGPRTSKRFQILVCDGPSCGVTFESELLKALLVREVDADADLKARVHVVDYNCFGRCSESPNVFVRELAPGDDPRAEPDPNALSSQRGFYPGMDEPRCRRVLAEHCGEGRPVAEWVDDY